MNRSKILAAKGSLRQYYGRLLLACPLLIGAGIAA
jgi:hypothetical protein